MAVLIKRYANRKLYNTQTSRYITLKGIAELGLTLELTDTIKAFEKQYLEEFAFLKEIY